LAHKNQTKHKRHKDKHTHWHKSN